MLRPRDAAARAALIVVGCLLVLSSTAVAGPTTKYCKGFNGISSDCFAQKNGTKCLSELAYNDADRNASCFWIARNPSYGFETVKYNVRTLQGRDVYQEFPTIEGNCQHKVTITLPENMDNRVGAYVYVYNSAQTDVLYPEDVAGRCVILPYNAGGPQNVTNPERNCSVSLNLPNGLAGPNLGNLAVHVTFQLQDTQMINWIQCDRESLSDTFRNCSDPAVIRTQKYYDVDVEYTSLTCPFSPNTTLKSVLNMTYVMGGGPFIADSYDWYQGYENGAYWDVWTWLAYGFKGLNRVQWMLRFDQIKSIPKLPLVVLLMKQDDLLEWMNTKCTPQECLAPNPAMAVGSALCVSSSSCNGWAFNLDVNQRYHLWWGYANATFTGVSYTGYSNYPTRMLANIKLIGNYTLPPPSGTVAAKSAITPLINGDGLPFVPRAAITAEANKHIGFNSKTGLSEMF